MTESNGGEVRNPIPIHKTQLKYLTKFRGHHQKQENLKMQALTDPLTGIWNRRAMLGDYGSGKIKDGSFVPFLTREIALARSGGQKRANYSVPLSILMLDIDHFKQFNDNNGHIVGDFVLRKVAEILNINTRKIDIVGRYGGEEILIILPEANLVHACADAERLRALVEKTLVEYEGKKLQVTFSIGAAELKDSHKNQNELISEADKNLYQAKNRGRNQVFPPAVTTVNSPM